MGNCCKPASSMEWGGEDWTSLTSKNIVTRKTSSSSSSSSSKVFDEAHGHVLCLGKVQKEKILGTLRASSDHVSGKVKIRMSKKELKELLDLGGIENQKQVKKHVGRASAEQVLFRLMNNAKDHDAHHRFWKPVLETIPEVS
ncbi:uncharacterized protein LOC113874647 [Abrus precatorius]|uniref:Uncharacterized protein LOC113874647 n=1 Tax=Abrus precatorius TaxID=3816 RepID=A0A8B8ML78_ABRPR|nr:uncharacterized protein LOC113874647 [Abrus precatorius]